MIYVQLSVSRVWKLRKVKDLLLIRKQDPEANIRALKEWEWGMEKVLQLETS